jgi:hypothetical protein
MTQKSLSAIIAKRKKWLAENGIQDWNDNDTMHVANEYAKLSQPKKNEKEDVEKLLSDLMIYVNDEAQRVAKKLNLDDYGKDMLHENMDMAFNEWKRKNFAGYNAGTK